jgi:hypothetical protein
MVLTFAGRPIRKWGGIMICNNCPKKKSCGILPANFPHVERHLQSMGIAANLDAQGGIAWSD